MGRINNGISGGFSGRVGTVIGGNWNGIDYMRSNGPDRTDAKSTAQLDQRARFLAVVQFLKPLKEFLRVGFKNKAVRMTAYNAATSYHLAHALKGISPDYRIDYSKVMVSQGKLPGALNPVAVSATAAEIEFTWGNNSTKIGAMANDRVLLVIYNPGKHRVLSVMGDKTRLDRSQNVKLPTGFSGDEVHCYISFQNASQSVISDSQFAGSLVVV